MKRFLLAAALALGLAAPAVAQTAPTLPAAPASGTAQLCMVLWSSYYTGISCGTFPDATLADGHTVSQDMFLAFQPNYGLSSAVVNGSTTTTIDTPAQEFSNYAAGNASAIASQIKSFVASEAAAAAAASAPTIAITPTTP